MYLYSIWKSVFLETCIDIFASNFDIFSNIQSYCINSSNDLAVKKIKIKKNITLTRWIYENKWYKCWAFFKKIRQVRLSKVWRWSWGTWWKETKKSE